MRVYTVRMDNTAVTSNITLVQIKPGVSSIVLLRAKIGQNSDAADVRHAGCGHRMQHWRRDRN